MRVLVCGGRNFSNRGWLNKELSAMDAKRHFATLIHGCATGADIMAGEWAKAHGIPVLEYPAFWRLHNRRAGAIRNVQMLEEGKPDLVVAFPGGRGTAHMVRISQQAGVEVIELVE